MCFPQNSSWISSVSGPCSGDQPCSDPCGTHPALPALTLSAAPPSSEALAGVAWALVFRLRKQPPFSLQLHIWPMSQPGRTCIVGHPPSLSGEGAMGGLELVSSSSPFPMPLPQLLPLAVPGRPPLSSAILIPQFPPAPSCHQQNLGTLRKLLPRPSQGSLPPASPGCGEA
uniref:Uncharacterized protein n=1 Tax=Pipistrellus kuhlii TaxID=59472 RepID=A0A7J7WD48_PIPKU|nr:hypothetical protein mPipKuh1_008038 [Pipistrellus kuhlii]